MNTQFNANVYKFTEEMVKNLIENFNGKVVGGEGMVLDDIMKHYFDGYKPDPNDIVEVEDMDKKKDSKKKQKKPPGQPKRPTTAFFFYTASIREEVKKKNPGKGVKDLSKVHGQMWADLTDTQKQPFITQNEKDKERYATEMEAWNAKKDVVKED